MLYFGAIQNIGKSGSLIQTVKGQFFLTQSSDWSA